MINEKSGNIRTPLYLVFGGELKSLDKTEFKNSREIDIVGAFSDPEAAYMAWKEKAQLTVDDAHARYFIVNLADIAWDRNPEHAAFS